MISISNKLALLAALAVLMPALTTAYYYGDQSRPITGDSFSIPEYDSQREIATELVAPFIFLAILLQLAFTKVLHSVFRDEDPYPVAMRGADDQPDVRKYATMMALTVTAMLVPTPFWDYMRFAAGSIGAVAVTFIIALMLYGFYNVFSAL